MNLSKVEITGRSDHVRHLKMRYQDVNLAEAQGQKLALVVFDDCYVLIPEFSLVSISVGRNYSGKVWFTAPNELEEILASWPGLGSVTLRAEGEERWLHICKQPTRIKKKILVMTIGA